MVEAARNDTEQARARECNFAKLVEEVMHKLCERASDPGFDQNSRQAIAKVIKYLKWMKDENFTGSGEYLRLLEVVLKEDKPSALAVQEIIQQMRLQYWKTRKGWGWFVKFFGSSAVFPLLVGIITSTLIILTLYFSYPRSTDAQLGFMDTRILVPLFWAAWIGTLASFFTRFESFYSMTTYHPLMVFATGFFKPFFSMVMAIAVLFILRSGVVTITGLDLKLTAIDTATYSALWAIGFLSGFSERFAPDFVGRAEGVFARTK